jgi:hypothetical protein
MSKPDALDGVKRLLNEELQAEVMLGPLGTFLPPPATNELDLRIYNRSTTRTFVVRIFELVESVQFTDHTKES